jgi:hypothetical protein
MTITEKFHIIRKACDLKMVCEVKLKNEPRPRTIQPIGVCLTIKRGLVIVSKQTDGYSKTGAFPKVFNFSLDDSENIRLVGKTFKISPESIQDPDICKDWIVHV